jgi:DNA recombination protein RmuC
MAARMETLDAKLNAGLVNTTKETQSALGEVRKQLAVIDAAQKNIADLSSQVVSLQGILSNKQARGAFGEVLLEEVVRDCFAPPFYEFQAQLKNGCRVDCLLKLAEPIGRIGVDAKFPLEAWRALSAAGDDLQRRQAVRAFATAIKTHVTDIKEKYILPGETADQAVMFLPSEAIYAELHVNHQDLLKYARQAQVAIVSPTMLMALLTTMRAVLRNAEMGKQAGLIQAEVAKLIADISRLDERVENLQKHFAQAEKDVREIGVSSGKVKSRAERIGEVELEEGDSAEVADLAQARGALAPAQRT